MQGKSCYLPGFTNMLNALKWLKPQLTALKRLSNYPNLRVSLDTWKPDPPEALASNKCLDYRA